MIFHFIPIVQPIRTAPKLLDTTKQLKVEFFYGHFVMLLSKEGIYIPFV